MKLKNSSFLNEAIFQGIRGWVLSKTYVKNVRDIRPLNQIHTGSDPQMSLFVKLDIKY